MHTAQRPNRVFLAFALTIAAASPACVRQSAPPPGDAGNQHAAPNTAAAAATAAGTATPAAVHGNPIASLDPCIFVVFQASDDTMWFGSDGQGVYRVGGGGIVQFTTAHGLCGNRVRSIQEDRAGNILVNSDGGVSRFDGRAFRALRPVNTDATAGEWRLDPGDLWFTGWQDEGIVYRYDGTHLHRLAFPATAQGEEHIARYPRSQFPSMAYSPYDTYTIYKDRNGHVWFGTGTLGACRYDGRTFAWIPRAELEFGDEDAFGVRSIIEDKDGAFWFSRTLHRFDVSPSAPGEQGTVALRSRALPGIAAALHADDGVSADAGPDAGTATSTDADMRAFTHIMSAVRGEGGELWMATLDGSVWRVDGERATHSPVRDGTTPVRLYSIQRDRHGGLWLGTHAHGAYRFDGAAFVPFRPQ